MYWVLTVTKQMKLVDYDDRLKVSRELTTTLSRHGLRHQSLNAARAAAEAISKNPLVMHVKVTRMQEVNEGVWQNGIKQKED